MATSLNPTGGASKDQDYSARADHKEINRSHFKINNIASEAILYKKEVKTEEINYKTGVYYQKKVSYFIDIQINGKLMSFPIGDTKPLGIIQTVSAKDLADAEKKLAKDATKLEKKLLSKSISIIKEEYSPKFSFKNLINNFVKGINSKGSDPIKAKSIISKNTDVDKIRRAVVQSVLSKESFDDFIFRITGIKIEKGKVTSKIDENKEELNNELETEDHLRMLDSILNKYIIEIQESKLEPAKADLLLNFIDDQFYKIKDLPPSTSKAQVLSNLRNLTLTIKNDAAINEIQRASANNLYGNIIKSYVLDGDGEEIAKQPGKAIEPETLLKVLNSIDIEIYNNRLSPDQASRFVRFGIVLAEALKGTGLPETEAILKTLTISAEWLRSKHQLKLADELDNAVNTTRNVNNQFQLPIKNDKNIENPNNKSETEDKKLETKVNEVKTEDFEEETELNNEIDSETLIKFNETVVNLINDIKTRQFDFEPAKVETLLGFIEDELNIISEQPPSTDKTNVLTNLRNLTSLLKNEGPLSSDHKQTANKLSEKIVKSYVLDGVGEEIAKQAGMAIEPETILHVLNSIKDDITNDKLSPAQASRFVHFGKVLAKALEGSGLPHSIFILNTLNESAARLRSKNQNGLADELKSAVTASKSVKSEFKLDESPDAINLNIVFIKLKKGNSKALVKDITDDLNLLSYHVFKSVPRSEAYTMAKAENQVNMKQIPEKFNHISNLVQTTIISSEAPQKAISIWINVALNLAGSNNFYAAGAIFAALDNSSITRLYKSENQKNEDLKELKELFNMDGAYREYNKTTKALEKDNIPYFPYPGSLFNAYTTASEIKTDDQLKILNQLADKLVNIPKVENAENKQLKTTLLKAAVWDVNQAYIASKGQAFVIKP